MIIQNSKKRTTRSKRAKILFTLLVIAILLVGAGTIFFTYKSHEADKAAMTQKSKDEAQTESAKKTDANNSSDPKTTPSTDTTSQEIETTDAVTVALGSLSQSNGTVNASATMTNASADGVCVFLFTTEGDKPVTREVNSSMTGQQRTCSTSIPEVEFSKLGTWKLNVTFYLNNQKSEASEDVTIR